MKKQLTTYTILLFICCQTTIFGQQKANFELYYVPQYFKIVGNKPKDFEGLFFAQGTHFDIYFNVHKKFKIGLGCGYSTLRLEEHKPNTVFLKDIKYELSLLRVELPLHFRYMLYENKRFSSNLRASIAYNGHLVGRRNVRSTLNSGVVLEASNNSTKNTDALMFQLGACQQFNFSKHVSLSIEPYISIMSNKIQILDYQLKYNIFGLKLGIAPIW